MLTTLPPSCAVVMKSGNLNFLEASGPLQARNGTAFFSCTNAVVQLVEALRYKPKGRGFGSRWGHYDSLLT
jgi:hypothetical protein